MATRTRTRLDTNRRRAQLVEVALELFGNRPWNDVSMDDVAREAGVSHGLVYHYFPDKRALLLEVLRSVTAQLLAANVADTSKSPTGRLFDGLRAHVAFAEAYPVGYTTLVSGANGADEDMQQMCEEARWQGLEEIIRSLGVEEASPALRVALRGWSGFQEGAIVEWLKRRDLDREELVQMLARALGDALRIAGVATPAAP